MDASGLSVIQNENFSLLMQTKQLMKVTFCDMNAGIIVSFGHMEQWTDGLTDVEVEIVI